MTDDEKDGLRQTLAVFHHDAATPMAVVSGLLELLHARADDLPPDVMHLVVSASRQAEVLSALLDQLRVADQDEVRLSIGSVELVQLARDIVEDLGGTLLADHHCQVDAPHGPVTIEADAARLRQAISNLLHNAVAYSPAGTRIQLRVLRRDDAVELWVTDEGSGIAPADLIRVFERYERAGSSTGLGLGLYVAQRIVEAHGGRIRAEPAPEGSGARLVIGLPTAA